MTATRVVAISCRISVDKSGHTEGVKAQTRWGTEYAGEAWPGMPVEVFADGSASAMKDDGDRPEHDRFKEWLRDGRIAHVWAVEQSRLERDEVKWFMLAAELEAAGVDKVHTKRDGIVDVRGELAGIKAVLNAGEVRKMKKRLHDTLADKAAQGEPPGSSPFGYGHSRLPDGTKTLVIIEEQAEAIRKAARLVLDGWSRENIASELRDAGLVGTYRMKVRDADGEPVLDEHGQPVTRPSRITAGTVTSMVTNPTVAGHRVYQGRIVGRGNWPAILDEDTWQAVGAKLKAPHVVRRTDGGTYQVGERHFGKGTGRKYLLTGDLTGCGVCQAPMVGTMKQLRNKSRGVWTKPYLLCHPRKQPDGSTLGAGCVGIMMPETEAYVLERMWEELDKPAFLDMIGADTHAADRKRILAALDGLDRQRDDLAAMWALPAGTPGALTMAEWQTARTQLTVNEQELRRELAEIPPPLLNVNVAEVRASWPDATLDEQREFVRKVIQRITINRATPGTKGFDDRRVVIDWRKR